MASLITRQSKTGPVYYVQYWQGPKQKRFRASDSFQIAKQKLRDFENAQARGDDSPLPTATPTADVVTAYVEHLRQATTPKSCQTNIYYLRDLFGPICEALKVTSRKLSTKTKKRPPKPGQDRRRKAPVIDADCFEQITTAGISSFISGRMASRGLAPKTANHYRGVLSALFSWAMSQRGVRMPKDKNPAAGVRKYKELAPEIRFLSLGQVDEQLNALADDLQLQVMVAVLIYAGLRREELLWLTHDDVDWEVGNYGILRIRAKTAAEESWQPKTKVNRGVPVSGHLRLYLDKWRLQDQRGPWLFPNDAGGRMDPDNFSPDLRTANAAKGLAWTNLHFRHTFGSLLAIKGESLFKIATLMGNSPEICRRHYAALVPEALLDSVEFRSSFKKESGAQPT